MYNFMPSMEESWFHIACFPKFGSARLMKLWNGLREPVAILNASSQQLTHCGIEPAIAEEFVIAREDSRWQRAWERHQNEQISMLFWNDKRYPELLSKIHHPSVILFYKGDIVQEWNSMVSVVGTRTLTIYGKTITRPFVRELGQHGVGIVSGLALGIDSEAHAGALEARAPTVAVLAGGVDSEALFPNANRDLARQIIEQGGCILTEQPTLTFPLKHYFPLRNRIIAGLTRATIVVEADEQSGALITAKSALEENREVFAIPGPITSEMSKGTNGLIKLGARCVTEPNDILEVLEMEEVKRVITVRKVVCEDPTEQKVLGLLSSTPMDIDSLIRESGLSVTAVQSTISILELKGWARAVGPALYVKETG